MNNIQAYSVPRSDRKYICVGYNEQLTTTLTEFQIEGATDKEFISQMDELMVAQQKACLTLAYCSPVHLLGITFEAITQHIKNRLEIIFKPSF